MAPILQTLLDKIAGEETNASQLERELGGESGVLMGGLATAVANVDLGILATLAPAMQDLVNIALNSTAESVGRLEYELGGISGVRLAILAAIMASGGGGGGEPISNPYIAYVRTNGDDDTAEIGNPAKPFLTGTAAWVALKALHNSTNKQHSFHFGAGEFTIELTPTEVGAGYEFFLSGDAGFTGALLGSNIIISCAANNGIEGTAGSGGEPGADNEPIGDNGGTGGSGDTGGDGDSLNVSMSVSSNLSVYAKFAFTAGEGGPGGPGGPGGAGGYGSEGNGANGDGGPQGSGGNGGNLTGLIYCYAVLADFTNTHSGYGGAGSTPGSDGAYTFGVTGKFSDLYLIGNSGASVASCFDNVFYP